MPSTCFSAVTSLGPFVSIFALVAVLSGIAAPVPGTFVPRPVGERSAPTIERCLVLRYSGPGAASYLPRELQLTARRAPYFDRPGQPAYVAGSRERPYFAVWRPAGHDSIDIAWHASPTLRLPLPELSSVDGIELVGRGGEWAYYSLYSAMLGIDAFTVVAREHACAAPLTPRTAG
jgi:hypothetical protein